MPIEEECLSTRVGSVTPVLKSMDRGSWMTFTQERLRKVPFVLKPGRIEKGEFLNYDLFRYIISYLNSSLYYK